MSTTDPGHLLRACLDAFAADPQVLGKKLRYLLDHNPAVFDHVALTLIAGATDSPEVRYTIALLAARGRLARLVRLIAAQDPGSAGMLAHIAQKVDAHMDFGHGLAADSETSEIDELEARASLLCPLGEALRGGLDLFAWLASEGEMKAQSKSRLARVVGRGITLHSMLLAFLDDSDPRVRANAVESIWNTPGTFPLQFFHKAARDPHHRVAANALVGLYLAGEVSALGSLITMATSPNPLFQAAAVWAMGRTGDERFEQVLKQIRAEGRATASLLRNVLPAMARIRQSRQVRESRNIDVTVLASQAGTESVSYIVSAQTKRGAIEDRLRPIEFHPYNQDTPIWDYQVAGVEPAGPIHLSWLLPATTVDRNLREALNMGILKAALGSKQPRDSWSVAAYRESRPSHFTNDSEAMPHLADCLSGSFAGGLRRCEARTDAATLLADAAGLDPLVQPLNVCTGAAAAAQPLGASQSPVHLILVADLLRADSLDSDDMRTLIEMLRGRAVVCHVLASLRVSAALAAALSNLACRTGGWVVRGEVESSAASAALLAGAIRRHWRLTIPMEAVQLGLSLRIVSGTWRGQTALPVPEIPVPAASAA